MTNPRRSAEPSQSHSKSKTRCAIYTRKSSEEGLEQAFNSLHAQREACEAYIVSQRHEGWFALSTNYDDGGFSGGSMERPALAQLLADVRAGQVDVVVVYKIDRLTRSLFDFAKIVEIFDAQNVSFVSITQSFNTTTSMGRLTLNVLLSFAQFEREVTGERIRDKIAASKRKGMWMGGSIPLGYDLKDHKLIINPQEAETVRFIYRSYLQLGSVPLLRAEVNRAGLRTKVRITAGSKAPGGGAFWLGHLYWVLKNPIYAGLVRHKAEIYPGDHAAIIERTLWDRVQQQLSDNTVKRIRMANSKDPSLLVGLLFDHQGVRMTPTHSTKTNKRLRYYFSNTRVDGQKLRIPAREIEEHVAAAVRALLSDAHRVMDELGMAGRSGASLAMSIDKARGLAARLSKEASPDRFLLIRSLIERVVLQERSIDIAISRSAIARELELPNAQAFEGSVALAVKIEIRRIRNVVRLIMPANTLVQNRDPAMIKALARAHTWFEMLRTGKARSIAEVARMEDQHRSYVSSVLSLAFLAPEISEAILEGRQPLDLTLDRLLSVSPFPLNWQDQKSAFGFQSN